MARPELAGGPGDVTVDVDVALEALLDHAAPAIEERRNPFRFGSPAGGARGVSGSRAFSSGTGERDGRSSAPAGAGRGDRRIPAAGAFDALEFIGVVETRRRPGRVAVLRDGDGVHHGSVSDVIQGRYRILSIAAASIEIEDLARRTQAVLRLSGS